MRRRPLEFVCALFKGPTNRTFNQDPHRAEHGLRVWKEAYSRSKPLRAPGILGSIVYVAVEKP